LLKKGESHNLIASEETLGYGIKAYCLGGDRQLVEGMSTAKLGAPTFVSASSLAEPLVG
jgi:hypothetical protein